MSTFGYSSTRLEKFSFKVFFVSLLVLAPILWVIAKIALWIIS